MVHALMYHRAGALNQHVNRIAASPTAAAPMLLAEANPKRRWLAICCASTSAAPVLLAITEGNEPGLVALNYAPIELTAGGSAIFSRTGDMPYTGAVWGIGVGGTATVIGAEVVDY